MEPLVPTQWQYQKHYRNFDAIDTTKDDMIFLQVYMKRFMLFNFTRAT